MNEELKNVVVCEKGVMEGEVEEEKKEMMGKVEKGEVVEGRVKNMRW